MLLAAQLQPGQRLVLVAGVNPVGQGVRSEALELHRVSPRAGGSPDHSQRSGQAATVVNPSLRDEVQAHSPGCANCPGLGVVNMGLSIISPPDMRNQTMTQASLSA